jgi:putative ABC transport system ATP-binding protein
MIELQHLTKRHRAGDIETTALDAIDLQIEAGEYVAVTGPSGCGKSTLLGLLGLLDKPTSGRYLLQGEDVVGKSGRELAAIRRGRIGFVFQSFNLVDEMTVHDNVQLALRYSGEPEKTQRARVAEVLERLGIGHRAQHHPSQLSGGQQQRVAIARAIAARPALLLADEPTGNLDSAHGQDVMRLLRELNDEGTTLVMVTHSAEHAALASRTVRLLDGRVLVDAQAEHLA